MRISQKRQQGLYEQIHEPIMDLRIRNAQLDRCADIDAELFELELKIWKRVKCYLRIVEGE